MNALMEYNEVCPNCGMNTFEANENGTCIYCGHELEEEDILDGVF